MSRANQRRTDPEAIKASHRRSLKRMGRTVAFSILIGATVASALWLNQRWSVTDWQIQAEAPIKAAIEAELQAMESRDFLSTRPQLLRQAWLAQIPDLAAVRITRVLPNSLRIEAEERVPVALWQDEQGLLHLFDGKGDAYRLLRNGESPNLPLLRVTAAQLASTRNILMALAQQDARQLADLSEIRTGSRHWQIYFSRGVSWLIPQGKEIAVLDRIASLLKQPRWRNRHWRVDARLDARWFIRPAGHGGVI